MTDKVSTRDPEWLKESAGLLRQNFSHIHCALLDAAKRAAWLGLFLNYIKERGKEDHSISHGQFGPWLKNNLPDLNRDTVAFYMAIGRNIAKKTKLQFSKFGKSEICQRGELPDNVLLLVEGKTQNQLFLEFKQAKVQDDCLVVAPGRAKGCRGTSKTQRDDAKATEEAGRRKALAHDSRAFRNWIDKNCDDRGFGTLPDAEAVALEESCRLAAGFLHSLNTARKGTAQND